MTNDAQAFAYSASEQTDSPTPSGRTRCKDSTTQLASKLSRYRDANPVRSIFEIAVTALPLVLLWAAMWCALNLGYIWLYLLLAAPTAAFLVRLFMIQHDCGHGAFFKSRHVNDWVGRTLGVLTLTPYDYWRRTHAAHHASSGNLDRRGMGDVDTLTVREFEALPRAQRWRYWLYRHPVVLFFIGPFYLFFIQNRFPRGLMRAGWAPWISAMGTNVAIGLLAAAAIWSLGLVQFLLLHMPVAFLAAAIGVWLFYVQHQFEETLWAENNDWNAREAALHGSSHYDLPPVLRWFTANIGVHHVHHLVSKIPFYRLQEVMRDFPELRDISRLTLIESIRCIRLVLWDEDRKRLISFRELRRRSPATASRLFAAEAVAD